MANTDKELLKKSQAHSENLLKIVKDLQNEKTKLLMQIKLLEEKLNNSVCDNNLQVENSLLREQNTQLKQENIILARQYNETVSQYQILMSKSKEQQISQYTSPRNDINKQQEYITQLEVENQTLKLEQQKQKSNILELEEYITKIEYLYQKEKNKLNKQSMLQSSSLLNQSNLMEVSQQMIAQSNYNKSQIVMAQENVNFFQEFYIISLPCTSIQSGNNEPSVIFKHPVNSENHLKQLFSALPLFAYPQGIKYKLSQHHTVDIIKILQDELISEMDFTIQIFTPNKDSGKDIKNNFIQNSNPDQLLYAIIVYSEEFIADKKFNNSTDVVKSKKQGNKSQNIYVGTVAYVLLTYYPFHKLCVDLLTNFIRTLKSERLQLSKTILDGDGDLREIDQLYFTNQNQEVRQFFENLQQLTLSTIYKSINGYDNGIKFSQKLTTYQNTSVLIFELAPNNLLQGWSAKTFVQVFYSLILERKIALIGKTKQYTVYLMLLFSFCIKPLKYYHPFVLNVPENLLPLLDAPIPVFIGLPQEYDKIEQDDVVIVNSNLTNVIIKNLEQIESPILNELEIQISKLLNNQYSNITLQIDSLLNLMKNFMKQILAKINNSKDEFVQRIQETQIYQIQK